jgi:hypothetical protein
VRKRAALIRGGTGHSPHMEAVCATVWLGNDSRWMRRYFSEKRTDHKRRQLCEDCQGLASPAWLFKEARQVIRHGWNEQAAIQEQVPHFAACFSNKEASMVGCAVGRSITVSVIRFMIRANRIVGANPQAFQGAPEDMRKSGSGCDETTKCPLSTRTCGVDQDAAAVDIAARSGPGKRVNSLFQRTGWISAVQCDLGHQCVRDTVKKDIWGPRVSRRFARKPFLPMAIAGQEFLVAMRRGLLLEPLPDRRFSKLLNRRQPVSVTGDWCAANAQLNVFDIAIRPRRCGFKSRETVEARHLPQAMNRNQVLDPRKSDVSIRVCPNIAPEGLRIKLGGWMIGAHFRASTCERVELRQLW